MRLIDADALLKHKTDHETISTHLIYNAPTVDAVPVRHGKWIYGNDFHWYTASCNKCGYQRRTDIKAMQKGEKNEQS